ncbi:HK97 family phage prohead protease [Phenylobacterium kunshanense]|nr:HK97 family phage prohead protease [Phenylobacterium kunshanense]
MADVVEPLGAQFKLPLPLLLDHNHSQAVGAVEWASANKDGIRFRARIPKIEEPGDAQALVDKAWHLTKHGLRRSVSIGFRPLETTRLDTGGYRYVKWDWYELSLVSVPAQPEAEILAVRAAENGRRAHVAKITPATAGHTVKLGPVELALGRELAASRQRTAGQRGHVARLPARLCTAAQLAAQAEKDARDAAHARALAELEARKWRS